MNGGQAALVIPAKVRKGTLVGAMLGSRHRHAAGRVSLQAGFAPPTTLPTSAFCVTQASMLLREAEAAAAQTGSAMEQASFLAPLLQGVLRVPRD